MPTVSGAALEISARSICVHGDTPGAVALASAVRTALEQAGVTLTSFA
ncbi:MAG TPA: LamB/YcsF family protein [Streptosporangiaceae bacterium]|nr:LamB/YcsF family protein [Streptosporangiaceae bacterium]